MTVKKYISLTIAVILTLFAFASAAVLFNRGNIPVSGGETFKIGDRFLFGSQDSAALADLKEASDFKYLFDDAKDIVEWRVAALTDGDGVMLIPEAAFKSGFYADEFIGNIYINETESALLSKFCKIYAAGSYIPALFINPEQIRNLSGDGTQAYPFIDRETTGTATTVSVETEYTEISRGEPVIVYAHVMGKNFYNAENGKVQFSINDKAYGNPVEVGVYGVAAANIIFENAGAYKISARYIGEAEYLDSLEEDERSIFVSVGAGSKNPFINLSASKNTAAQKTRTEIEKQVKDTWDAVINNTKKSVGGASYTDLHSFYYNYAGATWCDKICRNCPDCWRKYGMCHVFTISQLCYLDIISYDRQAALKAGVEESWSWNKLGAGGVLEAGLWTNGSRNADGTWVKSETCPVILRDGTVMQGDYLTYGMTLKKGVAEKNRLRSGVTSITSANVNEHMKTWEPKINAVNAIFRNYIENLPSPAYNILLEYSPVNPRDIVFGHIMFIHAKIRDENGVDWIYFIESHDRGARSASGGLGSAPAQGKGMQRITVDDFLNRYSTRPNFTSNGLFIGGMCFEISPVEDIFRLHNISVAENGPPEMLSGGLFALTADYKATPQSAPRRVILNLKESDGAYNYEVNQWAAYDYYDAGNLAQYAKTKNNSGDKQARYVFSAVKNGVTIDLSTLSRNNVSGYRERFSNFEIVQIEAPDGYKTPPVSSGMQGGSWVTVNEKIPPPDVFRFQSQSTAENGPPEILSGGLFALTADYTATPQSAPRRVIFNLKESTGTCPYEVNQWAAYDFYDADDDPEGRAKTKDNDGDKRAKYVIPASAGNVTVDLSTLSKNTIIGKKYRERFGNFEIVQIEAPDGYKTPPVSSGIQGSIWVVVNEKIPVEDAK